MKKVFINIMFVLSFLLLFFTVANLFADDFVEAFSPDFFPKDKRLNISACQRWSEDVRDFHVNGQDKADQISVLMYHRVIEDNHISEEHLDNNGLLKKTIIRKSAFEKQMQALKDAHYTTLTPKEFLLFMEGKLDIPKKSILLTFDDGYKDNVVEVYPILKKHGFKALNFVITEAITEKKQSYNPEKHQYLSVNEIEKSCDVFSFQSHTYNYHKENEKEEAYLVYKPQQDIEEDISISLVNLDQNNLSFAYPFGEYNQQTIQSLQKLGFKMAFTTEYKDAKPGMNMYEIPRKEVFPEDTVEDFKHKINMK
ncbi:peptidoglycan/xylan/chitin deacetylase (PgdA/CDA1 family) [Salirhabdus euzebyi]|uniref:Peptidoglycan/xylan/chitin deacetylase (PgdA/CDA1 family) n=1 Tax=Salirhabdus euzebyi TaxID=394506 RepID=A0A841Q1M0_9BACI|nr:polysaccharide deacetylase family protein [Salirhabdus euzebyi]MBB6451735.1 peptidoglycan/xylan/chitin deacetylase (PgdA/CDA1 family) [Salirhabdus euzebyi]